MTRRVIGGSLFGIGLFLLVVALGLAVVIAPLLNRLPIDMDPSLTTTEASDATFVQVKMVDGAPSLAIERAGLRVRTSVQPDATATAELTGDVADRAVVWNVFQQTERADTGEMINASQSRIALDRRSGAGAEWRDQCLADQPLQSCTAGSLAYQGQLYQFPFDTKKQTHRFFDGNLGRAVPIDYRGTDTIEGLRAYRFEQVIPDQPLKSSPEILSVLRSRFAPGATSATMMYRTHRTVWVEPVSGVIVSIKDEQHHTLVPDVGAPTVVFDATFRLDSQSLRTVSDAAANGRMQILALRRYVPLGLGLLGILALVAGFWVTRRAASASGSSPLDGRPGNGRRPANGRAGHFTRTSPTVGAGGGTAH
jgi:hypothetical protein